MNWLKQIANHVKSLKIDREFESHSYSISSYFADFLYLIHWT